MAKQKGIGTPHFSKESKAEAFESVCQLYETQHCSLDSACEAVGVSVSVFYLWKGQNAEFGERYKKAKERQEVHYWEEIIRPLSKTSLERLLRGETKIEYKKEPLAKEGYLTGEEKITVTESEILPNPTITIFTMKGFYPDRFIERLEHNMSPAVEKVVLQIGFRKPEGEEKNSGERTKQK